MLVIEDEKGSPWRRHDTLALQGEAQKEHLDIEFFLGILAIDGQGSITKNQTIHPDETSGSARGGHLGGQ